MKGAWVLLGVTCGAWVVGFYAYTAPLGRLESSFSKPADDYYNLLVRGFRDGHLSLKKEVPTGFARLTDPYDPRANRLYRNMPYAMSDQSYYKGRLYLYFGVTPALILFWPFVALTGHYLSHRLAVTIFCAVGITVSLALLRALWRRYFAEVGVGVVAMCAVALGLATGVPVLLPQSDIYRAAISCGYMLTMLTLGAIWCALHDTERRSRWLMAASVAYGLAVGSRPSLLFGGIILLVPVVYAWRERRSVWIALMAATVPITLIGLGLMFYNVQRFNNPFEFGQHYQLGDYRQVMMQHFNLRYLWFNFRVNFLEPARWSAQLPFVHKAVVPPLPSGYTDVQDPFGVLTNVPLVWLALAAPLGWRDRSDQERCVLRWFVTAVGLLFGVCALTLGFYNTADVRYEVDFLPALVFLAVMGILGFERALADRPARRRLMRWGWSALLGFSVVFNILVSVKNYAVAGCSAAIIFTAEGRLPEATRIFENALQIEPDYADGHYNLGLALWQAGKQQEAIQEFEYALRLDPNNADAHNNLGSALIVQGRLQGAMGQWEQVIRINPDDVKAHYNLGLALAQAGKMPEAIEQLEQVLRINPDDAKAHDDLGVALAQAGRIPEAMGQWEQTLRINPDDPKPHFNLGNVLQGQGRVQEAIEQYEQALRLQPNLVAASNALARLRASQVAR